MPSLLNRIKIAFSFLFLGLLQADSIQFSYDQVVSHFKQNQSYIYLASHLGYADASLLLYQRTNSPQWLKLSAQQGNPEAAFLWYKTKPFQHQVWLDSAANNGYVPAVIEQIEVLIAQQQMRAAERLITKRKDQSNIEWHGELDTFVELESMVDLALLPSEEIELESNLIEQNTDLLIDYQCRMKVQPVVAYSSLRTKVDEFRQALDDSLLTKLPICMNSAIELPELQTICGQDRHGRAECDLKKLSTLSQIQKPKDSYSHILLVLDKGEANTRGGLMYLDKQDSQEVFIHELAHWLGLVDEYRIGSVQQRQLCNVKDHGYLGRNLFVTRADMSKEQAQQLAGRELYPAATCQGSNFKAYKFAQAPSFMQYLQQPISPFYLALIQDELDWSEVVPVAMNFAHIYQDQYDIYLSYIKRAAATGYQGAITEFSQHLVEQGSYLEAKNLLEFGAEHGGVNSLLLLGHAYLEGRWLPRDLAESALWYKKAAEQNDGYGLYFYGKCLEMGWGCIQSAEQAFSYYQKSAQLGNKLAQKKLGTL